MKQLTRAEFDVSNLQPTSTATRASSLGALQVKVDENRGKNPATLYPTTCHRQCPSAASPSLSSFRTSLPLPSPFVAIMSVGFALLISLSLQSVLANIEPRQGRIAESVTSTTLLISRIGSAYRPSFPNATITAPPSSIATGTISSNFNGSAVRNDCCFLVQDTVTENYWARRSSVQTGKSMPVVGVRLTLPGLIA